MLLTRGERKRKNSERGRRGAEARWENYHKTLSAPTYPPELPNDCIRITIDNLINGKTHVMVFHPGSRRGRFKIDVDGQPWRECGWTEAMVKIRKACKRTPLYGFN